jgi:hypothetical protein
LLLVDITFHLAVLTKGSHILWCGSPGYLIKQSSPSSRILRLL